MSSESRAVSAHSQFLGHATGPLYRKRASGRALRALALALALAVLGASASAAPGKPAASLTEIAAARRVLEVNGYTDIVILSNDGRLVTASAVRDGEKSLVDVDPMTEIILPRVDLPPMPALAPVPGRRG